MIADLRDLPFFCVPTEVALSDAETSPWECAVEEAIDNAVETGRERDLVRARKDEWRDGAGEGAGREEEMPETPTRDDRERVGAGRPLESSDFGARGD